MTRYKNESGMSLLEIMVVVVIFAILGIITTRAIILTLQGSKKSESTVKVRENVDYALGVIERQIRNAQSIDVCLQNPEPGAQLDYEDKDGNAASFSCQGIGTNDGYVASGSARLTSQGISITNCMFQCLPGSASTPPLVNVTLAAEDATATGVQNTVFTAATQIYLRNY